MGTSIIDLTPWFGRKLESHDQAIAGLIDAIRELMRPPERQKKRPIGFITGEEKLK